MKPPEKTQRQVVLEILEERGPKGAHSFEFIQARIPRVAARVCELRAEGHSIDSEPEALHGAAKGVRYSLNVGVGAERPESSSREARSLGGNSPLSIDSGVAASSSSLAPASEAPPAVSMYDPWESAA